MDNSLVMMAVPVLTFSLTLPGILISCLRASICSCVCFRFALREHLDLHLHPDLSEPFVLPNTSLISCTKSNVTPPKVSIFICLLNEWFGCVGLRISKMSGRAHFGRGPGKPNLEVIK